MSRDDDLLITVDEDPKEQSLEKLDVFTIAIAAFPTPKGDLGFEFRSTLPEKPKVYDWLAFLYLSRSKVHDLYNSAIEKAIEAYMELQPEVGYEAARIDIENYLRSLITNNYEDNNSSSVGIRDLEELD